MTNRGPKMEDQALTAEPCQRGEALTQACSWMIRAIWLLRLYKPLVASDERRRGYSWRLRLRRTAPRERILCRHCLWHRMFEDSIVRSRSPNLDLVLLDSLT